MDDTVKELIESPTKPHVLPALPTELWLTVFEQVVTYDKHIFDQSLPYRSKKTHNLQKLQCVCRSWRAIVEPFVYRHLALNGDDGYPRLSGDRDLAADHATALACLLNQTTDSGTPKASWVRSFWIRRRDRGTVSKSAWISLRQALPALISPMTNLSELYCRVALCSPQIASIAHSHGSQLTKLAIHFGGRIGIPKVLPFLKDFTALTDLHLDVYGQIIGGSYSIEPVDLPNLRSLQIVVELATDPLLAWLTQGNMPVLSAFAFMASPRCIKTVQPEPGILTTFMAKYGAGLRTVTTDHGNPTIEVFPYTPSLDIFGTVHVDAPLEGLPISVTQLVIRRFGEHLGYQAVILSRLLQTAQLLPPEKKIRIIRVVCDHTYRVGVPFVWRKKLQQIDMRRMNTWRNFNDLAKGLLELGISVLDEQDVALTDVLEEMRVWQESITTELVESATNTC